MPLTADQVHHIRTSGLTDAHLSRLYNIGVRAIFNARRGKTHAGHPTVPDGRPRKAGGRSAPAQAIYKL